MKKTNKRLIVAILISSLFICVGYAEITNTVLNITGSIEAIAQTEVFITDVTTSSTTSTINGYLETVLDTKTVLETNSSSTVSYNVNLYNNSEKEYVFIGVLKHDDLYNNTNIEYTLTGLTEYETTIAPRESLTFTITFKYKQGASTANNILESKLNFRFREKPEISLSNEGESYTLEEIYAGYELQEYKFTVTNKNKETGKTNNVPMEYRFETTIEEPLEVKIYDVTNEITGSVALEGEKEYTLKIIWDETKNSSEYANKEYSCKVVLKAKPTNTDYEEYEINKEFNIKITTAKFYFGAEVDSESLKLENNEASLEITLKNYNSSSEYNKYKTNYQISIEDTSKFNLILEDENNGVIASGVNTNTITATIIAKDGQELNEEETVTLIIKSTKPYGKEITKAITLKSEPKLDLEAVQAGEYTGTDNKAYTEGGQIAVIPAGFTVSNIEGEKTIEKGLVIYSGNQEGKDLTTVKGTANQYVWIPVDTPSDIYGTLTSTTNGIEGTKFGKLYFSTLTDATTHYNWPTETGYSKTSYREPSVLSSYDTNESNYKTILGYNSVEEYKAGMVQEFNDMIASVEKYKGFYIGRYELTSTDGTISTANTVKGANPLVKTNWYNFYKACTNLEAENANAKDKVRTTIVWGCQWDQAVKKCLDFDPLYLTTNSNKYGNYKDSSGFEYTKIDGTTGTKVNGTSAGLIVSGCVTPAYNIYDMGGNVHDWTLEADYTDGRAYRGGNYISSSTGLPASYRLSYSPSNSVSSYCGCRSQLYIK